MNESEQHPLSEKERLFLAQDEFRQREIQRENEVFEAGIQVLSKHPAWSAVEAEMRKRLVNRCPGWSWSVVGRFDLIKPVLGRSMASSCGGAVH